LLAVLGASLLLGAWRGLVYELMSMLGWIAAFVLAQWWAPEVALRLPMSGATEGCGELCVESSALCSKYLRPSIS
jgi:membrane protein required for colicin V production